jgi:hypothetical protein
LHYEITAGIINPPIADHSATYAIIHNTTTTTHTTTLTTPSLSKNRYLKHQEQINKDINIALKNNSPDINSTDPEHACTALIQTLQDAIAPHKTIPKPQHRHNIRKPWITQHIKTLIHKQHTLHKRATIHPTLTNIQAHRNCRNTLKTTLRQAKTKYYETQLHSAKNDPKQTYTILNTLLPRKTKQSYTPTTIIYQNRTYNNPQDIADKLNDHFTTIGHRTAMTIQPPPPPKLTLPPLSTITSSSLPSLPTSAPLSLHSPNPPLSDLPSPLPPTPKFKLAPTTIDKVTTLLTNMKPDKATDIYNILPAMTKYNHETLAPIITTTFNNSINKQIYPSTLKLTRIAAIFKKQR